MSLLIWIAIGIGCILGLLLAAFMEWYEHRVYYRTIEANKRRLKNESK